MADKLERVTILDTEMRELKSSRTGYVYRLHIALPAGYADSDKIYPALYVLDPDLIFGTSTEIARLLARGQEIPPLILVGIGLSGSGQDMESYRVRDYVPKAQAEDSGDFLSFLREELVPFVNSQYRADPDDKALLGYSLAGLFGLYCLFHQPDTFLRYIIASPWMKPDEMQLFSFETEYATTHSDLAAQVFVAAGSLEPEFVLNNLTKLDKALRNRNYPNLRFEADIFQGETHLSVVAAAIGRSLRIVYQDEAASTAPR